MERKSSNLPQKRRIGITWVMFATLAIFILVTLAVVWFFQNRMLNYFYLTTKFSELEQTAEQLEQKALDEEALIASVYQSASDMQANIEVYVVDEEANLLVRARNGGSPRLSPLEISELYYSSMANDGTYVGTLAINVHGDHSELDILGGKMKDAVGEAVQRLGNGAFSAVYATIVENGESSFLIIQVAELLPLQSVVTTLQKQFLWIGVILLLLALLLAIAMSKLISRPIVRVNEQAKQLACGRYDNSYDIGGYREISELSETLRYASIELSKTTALQQELLSNVSHDLRTPLTMIRGYSEMMRDIPDENTPENMQVIIDETTRLAELVNDMLDISKIQAGTIQPRMEVFSLTETIGDTLKRYEKLITGEGYRIEFISDGDADVYADRGMLLQVIYNLINNAIHYTGKDLYVCVRLRTEDTRVKVSVYDTGEGIAKEDLPFIWDRYYRVDKVHKRAAVGTGLGLSIVKGILDMHGAEYGINSTIGVGSEFWFSMERYKIEDKTI